MPDIVNEVSKNTIGQDFHVAMAFKLEEWTCSLRDDWAPVTTCSISWCIWVAVYPCTYKIFSQPHKVLAYQQQSTAEMHMLASSVCR